MSRVVIIGAGIGGLATANLLARAGYQVTVYDKNSTPGGRAGRFTAAGFTFDTGPSWYLMPEVFEKYFQLLDEDIADHLRLERLDPAYKVFFESGAKALTIRANLQADAKTFESTEPGAGAKLSKYLERSAAMYQLAIDNFLYTNFERKRDLVQSSVLKQLPRLGPSALLPIDRYVRRYFKDVRLRQVMEYPMVFLGTSPFEAPALYSLMSHMDFNQGVMYPGGGLYAVIEALVAIGTKLGVSYTYDREVTAIITARGRATGVVFADGSHEPTDVVVSNADLYHTETTLLAAADRTYPQSYWDKKQAGPSALLMYLGVKGTLPTLAHHNLLFTEDWQANFSAIFKDHTWPQPASIYVCKPSHTDATVAPAGHENLFVLVPAPAGVTTAGDELEQLADAYLAQIAAASGTPDLTNRIVYKRLVGPADFASDFNSWQATALGLSHRLGQSAMFRPKNQSKKVSNLYYVGANTVPGIGLPMCLIGAELVYKRLAGDKTAGPVTAIRRLTND